MDPVGVQKKIAGSDYRETFQKKLDQKVGNLDGGFNTKSGTRKADGDGVGEADYQGTVKGKTTHTYGVDGKNDPETKR